MTKTSGPSDRRPGAARRWTRRIAIGLGALTGLVGATGWWLLSSSGPEEPDLAGELTRHTTTVGEHERTWWSYRPSTAGESVPVLLVLHGSLGDGAAIRETTAYRFDELAEEHGFLVAYPDGFDRNWNECRVAGDFAAKRENVDDVGFMRAIVDELHADGRVDRERVFATGFSSGGHMVMRLAYEATDLVSGIAPVAASVPVADNSRCTDRGEPVPAQFIAGTKDPMNPYEGGDVSLYGFGSRGQVLSAPDSAAFFARRNGAAGDPTVQELPERDGDTSTRAALRRWDGPAPVELVTIHGGGHQYPAPGYRGRRLLGPSAHDIDAPAMVVSFFRLDGA